MQLVEQRARLVAGYGHRETPVSFGHEEINHWAKPCESVELGDTSRNDKASATSLEMADVN